MFLKLPAASIQVHTTWFAALSSQTLHSHGSAKALSSIPDPGPIVARFEGFFTEMQVWQLSLT